MRAPVIVGIDLVAIIVFAVIGRASHAHELSLAGIAQTAWPFLVAGVIGSTLSLLLAGPWWRQGLVAWLVTTVGGMVLRVLGGDTAAMGFIVVGTILLALFLIGWRWLARGQLARVRPSVRAG